MVFTLLIPLQEVLLQSQKNWVVPKIKDWCYLHHKHYPTKGIWAVMDGANHTGYDYSVSGNASSQTIVHYKTVTGHDTRPYIEWGTRHLFMKTE
nr:MAG TPA: hypothetical protein [Bacteriophage sp.]